VAGKTAAAAKSKPPRGEAEASPVALAHGPKRAQILDAALREFSLHGFYGSTIPEIAARAKVGNGTIYRYFDTKEALLNALYQYWKVEVMRQCLTEIPSTGPFRQQFHVFWRQLAQFARYNPIPFAFLELHHHAPYLDEKSRQCEEESRLAAAQFIEFACGMKVIKNVQPELLMGLVCGALVGMVKASWQGLLKLDDKTLDDAEQCVWEAIRA
jgi:AcrR family transcriptional regulator